MALVFLAVNLLMACPAQSGTSGKITAPDETEPAAAFMGDFNGEPPSDIISLGTNLLALIDHVSGVVVFADEYGKERSRARLPGGFRVNDVRIFPDRTALIDISGNRKIIFSHGDQSPPTALVVKSVAPQDQDIAAPAFISRQFRRAGIKTQAGSGFTAELVVRSVTPQPIVSATFLGLDAKGQAYSLAREIVYVPGGDGNEKRTTLKVVLTVGRHDKTGRRIQVATLPLDELFKMPRGRYVAVEPSGAVVALLPLKQKDSRDQGVYLYRPIFKDEVEQKDAARPLRNARETLEAMSAAAAEADLHSVAGPAPGKSSLEVKDAPVVPPLQDITGRRSFNEMKTVASKIMTFGWQVTRGNLALDKQRDCAFGDGEAAHAFELPHDIKRAKENDSRIGVPYNWDGKGDLATIKSELAQGLRAGNICSEIDVKSPNTTGLDCSGFVAQVWGVGPFATADADNITTSLPDIDSMRWGDALNLKQHHIRLFVGQDVTPEHGLRIHSLESTSACSGTCEINYDVEHFNGYELIRLKPRK
jgi:cell wall-associated NlpC family hydrolase